MANTKIPSELIADSSITAAKLADGTITTADIADSNVTTAKIADSNVTTAKIGDAQVTTAKITDANVTTGKIADDAVTTAKMASNSVTSDTIASGITLAGTTTLSSHLVMGDNDYIKLGDSSDLLITHDGSGSWIIDNGTGGLVLASDTLSIKNAAYNEQMISAVENGAVTLYYDNNIKFVTKADGVDITGELQADSLDIDGNADITGNLVVAGADHTFYSAAADIEFNIGRDATQKININVDDNNVKLIAQQDADGNSTHTYALDRYFAGTGANNFEIQKAGSMQFRIDTNGAATFTHDVNIAADDRALRIGAGADFALFHDAVDSTMRTSTGNLILSNTSQNNDILFKGNDSGTTITALTLDMSEAGKATFNSDVVSTGIDLNENTSMYATDASLSYYSASNGVYLNGPGTNGWLRLNASGVSNNRTGIDLYGQNQGDYIKFRAGNTDVAYMNSAGNLGIGASSPQDRLHVIKDSSTTNDTVDVVRIEATSSGTPAVGFGPTIDFRGERGGASSDSMGRIGYVADTMTASRIDGAFVVETAIDGTYSEHLRVTSTGNVGIGTTGPLGKLHVRDGSAQAGISHTYIYDASAISIEATEPSLQLMAEDSGTHGGSLLWRYGNNAFAAIANPSTDAIDFTYGVTTANDFQVHSGTNMSSYKKIMSIGADGDVSLSGTFGTNSSTAFASMGGRLQFDTDYSDTQRGPNKIVLQEDGNWISGLGISNNSTDFYSGGNFTWLDSNGGNSYTQRMKIHASGCIDLGANADRSLGTNITTTVTSGSAGSGFWMSTGNSSATSSKIISTTDGSVGDLLINQGSGVNGGSIRFSSCDDVKMRINSNGVVLIGTENQSGISNGTTNFGFSFGGGGQLVSGTSNDTNMILNRSGGSGNMILIRNNGGNIGAISQNGSTITYGGTSDYRLKENVADMTNATTRLKQLKPKRFNFIADESNTLIDGFLAHEVSSIVPEAVVGEKDAEDLQMMDNSKLVPLLVKTIQELEARIATLES